MMRYPARRHSRLLAPALIAGVSLATMAILVRRAAASAKKRYPPKGKFIAVDGVRLHYTDSGGDGPAAILLHGNGATSDDWRISGVSGRLENRYRVIAFDRPGFGYSERPRGRRWTPLAQADLIKKALDELGIANPVLVGHSWGALVAAALAIAHPRYPHGLVLISGYYFPSFRPDTILFSPGAIPIIGDVLRYTVLPAIGTYAAPAVIRRMFAPREVPRRFLLEFPVPLGLRPSQLRAAAAESAGLVPGAASLESSYKKIVVPTVVMAGTADRIAAFDRNSERLEKLIDGSKLRAVADAGHMVHYFAPDAVAHAIDSAAEAATASREEARI